MPGRFSNSSPKRWVRSALAMERWEIDMSFHPELWGGYFAQDEVPLFPCPHCRPGRLKPVTGTLHDLEATYAKRLRKDPDVAEDYARVSFVLLLQCVNEPCGEVVAVSGEMSWE